MIARAAALLILAGCASGVVTDSRLLPGGPGAAISVDVNDVENPSMPADDEGFHNYVIHVEVSNNSDQVQSVRQIRISQLSGNYALTMDTSVRDFDEMIDPGKDHEFAVPARARLAQTVQEQKSNRMGFRAVVTLATGDAYEYDFEGPVR